MGRVHTRSRRIRVAARPPHYGYPTTSLSTFGARSQVHPCYALTSQQELKLAKATNDHGTAAKGTEKKIAKTKIVKSKKVKEHEFVMSDELAAVLSDAAQRLSALEKGSTKATFEIGAQFQLAKDSLPKKSFGDWVSTVSTYTVRSAWNFCLVNEKLGDIKERIIEASVPATSLISLAKAEDEVVEAVLTSFERGERLTGAKIKTMVAGSDAKDGKQAEADAYNSPGVAGLRKVAALKHASEIDNFLALLKLVMADVLEALKPLEKGRAVRKGDLALAIRYKCRQLNDLLTNIVAPLEGNIGAQPRWYASDLPKGSAWRQVGALIRRLSDDEIRWPQRAEFPKWLQNEVIPTFRFILNGEPLPSLIPSAKAEDRALETIAGDTTIEVDRADQTAADVITAGRKLVPDAPPIDPTSVVLLSDARQTSSGRKKTSKNDMPEPAV
jgi:hypothetical protein